MLITEAISHKRENVLPVNRMVLESSKFPAAALLTKVVSAIQENEHYDID